MPSSAIQWSGDDIGENIQKMAPIVHTRLAKVCEYQAQRGQNYMRNNAPWTDRTANARGGLFGKSFASVTEYTIVFYHTMPYGIWLETRWNGKYRIIDPTLQSVGKDTMGMFSRVLSGTAT